MEENSVQLSSLLNSLLHRAYHDLSVLSELLPRKTDVDKKIEIVQYARQTRLLLIRLLALVKWAGSSQPVHKCTEVANQLRHQSWVYVDTADQLVHLARQTLQQAAIPNLTLAPAIDVLSTGSYPRLPTCIKDRIIPTPPLPIHSQNQAYLLLDAVIRQRLSLENTHHLSVTSIAKGRVVLKIPYEFEVTLTVVGDDFQLPWRLLNCEILVGQSFPGSPKLIHSHHKHFLHQLTQSRLCSDDSSLGDLSSSLHYFCLALQLDCLHAQAERLSNTMCGVYVKVDEYSPGHQMKVAYWRPSGSSHFLSEFLLNEYKTVSWPKVVITVDPLSPDRPFSTSHYPPLPGGDGQCVTLDRERLCLENLLATCVRIRSLAMLRDLYDLLRGSVWEGRSSVIESPMCLRVDIPISSSMLSLSTLCTVLLSVDSRVGQVTASLQCTQPKGWGPLVKKVMIDMERGIITNKLSLLESLPSLQCALFLAHLSFAAADNGLVASHSIPLTPPLKLPTTLYIALRGHVYLVVSVKWVNGELQDSYQLLQTSPNTLPSPLTITTNTLTTNTPFLSLVSLVAVDPTNLLQLFTGSVTVHKCNMKLKRKLLDMNPCLPSNKRLCLSPSSPLPVLGAVLDTQLSLLHLHQSLQHVGISAVSDHHSQYGSRCINIFKFPPVEGIAGALLSVRLLSCQIWLSGHGYCYKMVFSSSSGPIVLHRELPGFSSVGEMIVSDWRDKVMLYSLKQELQTYLNCSDHNSLSHNCSIVEYTYERLLVRYHSHEVSVLAKGEGLVMSCSARSPHHFLLETLQQFLKRTQSLPLLLQGMSLTVEAATSLSSLLDRSPELTLSGISPSLVQLTYSNVHLTMRLMCEGEVSLCGLSYSRSPLTAVITHTTLHWILQMFIERHVGGDKSSSFDPPPPAPVDSTTQRTLIPSPVPISSPHLSSPLPSLPSLPPPASVSTSSQSHLSEPAWEHTVTSSQLHTLLHPTSSSSLPPLHSLLGSLNLLLHFVYHSAQDKTLHQLQFVSVSHGSYHYRTDSISLSLSMNNEVSSLKLSLNPAQEGMWSSNDLDTVTEFFNDQVSCAPYNTNAMTSFMRLLTLPVQLLKSCVHIMNLHLRPPTDAVWKIQLCLTVPEGSDLLEIATPNSSAVIFRGKLLLFYRLVRHTDGVVLVLPILHDPKSNLTYVARRQQQRGDVLQAVDHILRHSSAEHSLPHEPALFPRTRSLIYSNIPLASVTDPTSSSVSLTN